MEKPSKFEFYFWHSIAFIGRKKAIIIGVLIALLAIVCLFTVYITPKGFYDKPIMPTPVKQAPKGK
jgi:hypothetical protein